MDASTKPSEVNKASSTFSLFTLPCFAPFLVAHLSQATKKNCKRKIKTGMGSRSAMEERSGSRGRYHRQEDKAHVAEGLTKAQAYTPTICLQEENKLMW